VSHDETLRYLFTCQVTVFRREKKILLLSIYYLILGPERRVRRSSLADESMMIPLRDGDYLRFLSVELLISFCLDSMAYGVKQSTLNNSDPATARFATVLKMKPG